ncbi:MAG: RsmF rRNA methyltransferase first C-terminal domain-containing protein [Clostridia bacterium]|nr:RsmF rRNA methyltransferase first C-terminal domain-containing protein [Clostridia bacterium]
MTLPEEFEARQRLLLGQDMPAYLACLEQAPTKGLQLNTLKVEKQAFLQSFPLPVRPNPLDEDCFLLDGEGAGKHLFHRLGLYYMQEPSAACAVAVLDPKPGERVLDLCAAPGGKSARIAAKLGGRGLLVANEAVTSRCGILRSNLERLGVRNAVVLNAYPERLKGRFEGFFDRILVDAPCSGEGMFRKEPDALTCWSPANVEACAQRQLGILETAVPMLREGGLLVYSTCTFSPNENEEVCEAFVARCPHMEQVHICVPWGEAGLDGLSRRLYPHRHVGEGHFVAAFRKKGEASRQESRPGRRVSCPELERAWAETFTVPPFGDVSVQGERVSLLPADLPDLKGLPVLSAGVPAGESRKGRFEFAHGLFAALEREDVQRVLQAEEAQLAAFFRGEELKTDLPDGYAAVCAGPYVAGFGKVSGGRLKNKYPKGLRSIQ